MGFCIYNSVAVAAAAALARGVARVAIVDYDVHHGNGTQHAFYDDPRVLVISTHQFPCYPGSGPAEDVGEGRGAGFTLNVPIEPGATDGDYRVVFEQVVLPALHAFEPELLLVSAGFDAHMRDPLAQMAMSVAGCTALARMLRGVAVARRCPLVCVIEGGYHLQALRACLDGLVGVLDEGAAHRAELLGRDGGEDRTAVLSRDRQPLVFPCGADAGHEPPGVPRGREAGDDTADSSGAHLEAEPLSPDDVALVEHETPDSTHRGPAAVERVRAVQQPYWPTL